jgi:hypothetical protein
MPPATANFACNPAPDGGVDFRLTVPGEASVEVTLGRNGAMQLAAALMHNAGVSHATFDNGALQVHS